MGGFLSRLAAFSGGGGAGRAFGDRIACCHYRPGAFGRKVVVSPDEPRPRRPAYIRHQPALANFRADSVALQPTPRARSKTPRPASKLSRKGRRSLHDPTRSPRNPPDLSKHLSPSCKGCIRMYHPPAQPENRATMAMHSYSHGRLLRSTFLTPRANLTTDTSCSPSVRSHARRGTFSP